MLLDLSHLVIIISDLVDSVIQLIEEGNLTFAFPVAGNVVCFILIIGVILYFAWRSTDIPDLPPVPPRLFGGTITTDHGGRPHISGVRVGVVDRIDVNAANGPVIDSVIRSFPQRHHHTQHHQHNHGRHGTLFLRFLRRPQSRPLLPLPIPPQVGSRFQQAPNLIVYHQVSVYHHTHLPPERIQGRNVNLNTPSTTSSSSSSTTTTNSGATNSSNNNNNISESVRAGANIIPPIVSNPATNITSEGSAIHENDISLSTSLESSSRGQSIENSSLGELNNRSSTRLNETRRSLSENNLADLEVETEESTTVDVVELEVEDLNEADGSLRVVDVNLNGDVQLDGLNLNVNSNLVTMNRNHHNPNNTNSNTVNTTHGSSSNNNPITNSSSNSTSPSNDSNNSSATDNNSSTLTGNCSREHGIPSRHSKNDQGGQQQQQPTSSTNNSNTDKSVHSDSSDVRVILKFLNDTQIEVTTQLSEKISEFKRRHFATELSENKVVRLIFNGRVLDDDRTTLQESGIFDQCVVHCLIVTPQTSNQQQRGGQSNSNQTNNGPTGRTSRRNGLREGPEPGMFFIAILGIVLLFLWFICLHFRQLFTQSAVVSLLILSVVFVFGLVALYLPVQN